MSRHFSAVVNPVRFNDFVKIGLPFTVAAVGTAYLFLWFVWSK